MEIKNDFISLDNHSGLRAVFSSYGAGVYSLRLDARPLILECESEDEYLSSLAFYGKSLGRVAGRIPNQFIINSKVYSLPEIELGLSLHGGKFKSFSFQTWDYKVIDDDEEAAVEFSYISKDGENGFPGQVKTKTTYSMPKGGKNILRIRLQAETSEDTLVSLSNHMYWNIFSSKDVNPYILDVKSSKIAVFKPNSLLTCGIQDIIDDVDFRGGKRLKEKLDRLKNSETNLKTLDHTFVLDKCDGPQIVLSTNDVILKTRTDFDSVNIYVDSTCKPVKFKNRESLSTSERRAICIEPQKFPSLNNLLLRKGDVFDHYFEFEIERKY